MNPPAAGAAGGFILELGTGFFPEGKRDLCGLK